MTSLSNSQRLAYGTAWMLATNPSAYISSKGFVNRTSIPFSGLWQEILRIADEVRELSYEEQDALVLATAKPKPTLTSNFDFSLLEIDL